MKLQSIELMNIIGDDLISFFTKCVDEYGINPKSVSMTIYPHTYKDVPDAARSSDGVTCTLLEYPRDENDVIIDVGGDIYIPWESIFGTLIDVSLDCDKCINYYHMIIRHELGHVMAAKNTLVGLTAEKVCTMELEDELREGACHRPDNDASVEERMSFITKWHSLPREKAANDAAGITIRDIVRSELSIIEPTGASMSTPMMV